MDPLGDYKCPKYYRLSFHRNVSLTDMYRKINIFHLLGQPSFLSTPFPISMFLHKNHCILYLSLKFTPFQNIPFRIGSYLTDHKFSFHHILFSLSGLYSIYQTHTVLFQTLLLKYFFLTHTNLIDINCTLTNIIRKISYQKYNFVKRIL